MEYLNTIGNHFLQSQDIESFNRVMTQHIDD